MKSCVLIIGLLLSSILSAWELDTTLVMQTGPGVWYYEVEEPNIPWKIKFLKIDLRDSLTNVETALSRDRIPDGARETTSSMARRIDRPGHKVVGGINGDFFSYTPGMSIGLQVAKGEIIKSHGGSHGMSFDWNNRPVMNKPYYSGTITCNGQAGTLNGVNVLRDDIVRWFPDLVDNRMIIYNHFNKYNKNTIDNEVEIVALPLTAWTVNGDPVPCLALDKGTGQNFPVTDSTIVIAGIGSGANYLSSAVMPGDTLYVRNRIYDGYTGIYEQDDIKELIGGYPRFIIDGEDYVEQGWAEMGGSSAIHKNTREPSTAMGFSADSNFLYLVTCDGRQTASVGMTMHELAEFMIMLGAHFAQNMDSGGSTTIVVGDSVMNYPSDGPGVERIVVNAFFAVSIAPETGLDKVSIWPKQRWIHADDTLQLKVFGNESSHHFIPLDFAQCNFSCPPELGAVDASGKLIGSGQAASDYVVLDYNGYRDSCYIQSWIVDSIQLYPENTHVFRDSKLTLSAFGFGISGDSVALPAGDLTFSARGGFGTVDANGVFTAGAEPDSGWVAIQYGSLSDSVFLTVTSIGQIQLRFDHIVTDTITSVLFRFDTFDTDSIARTLNADQFTWTSSQPAVGVISTNGNFTGLSEGLTEIVVSMAGAADTAWVTVEVGEGIVQLDNFDTDTTWNYLPENLTVLNHALVSDSIAEGTGAVKLDYQFTYQTGNTYSIYLESDFPIYGVPDSIFIDGKSDGQQHRIYYYVSDDNDEWFELNKTDRFENTQYTPIKTNAGSRKTVESGSVFNFPVRLRQIRIRLACSNIANQIYSGTLYLDNLRVSYPKRIPAAILTGRNFDLPDLDWQGLYPNPFNDQVRLSYTLRRAGHVRIEVFNLIGEKICALLDERQPVGAYQYEWQGCDGANQRVAGGVYFVVLSTENGSLIKKVVYLK